MRPQDRKHEWRDVRNLALADVAPAPADFDYEFIALDPNHVSPFTALVLTIDAAPPPSFPPLRSSVV